MSYQCELSESSAQPTLAIRTRTTVQDLPQVTGRAFGMVAQYLGEQGEQPAGAPYAAYYNMDMQDLDVELGFPVARPLPGRGEIQPAEIPGGLLASVIHTGPYADCGAAYAALDEFIQSKGQQPTGVAYEMYLNDPTQTLPEQLMTKIIFPCKTIVEPAHS